jgi:hypothetical protein
MTLRLAEAVVRVVRVAARHPEGLEPLFAGHLESVAALYQLRPAEVERAREALATPEAQATARAWALALAPRRHAPTARRSRPLDVATLIAEAAIFPDGIALLTEAPLEQAAIRLEAHPFLVEEARAWLATRRQAHAPVRLAPFTPAAAPFTGDLAS